MPHAPEGHEHVCRVKFALNEKDVPYDSVLINLYSKPDW